MREPPGDSCGWFFGSAVDEFEDLISDLVSEGDPLWALLEDVFVRLSSLAPWAIVVGICCFSRVVRRQVFEPCCSPDGGFGGEN